MAALKFVIVFMTACVGIALGYSAGAPTGACDDLVPQHHTDPQASKAPYVFVVPKSQVGPGETIKVTVRGNSPKDTIKGFLIQARDGNLPIGTFRVLDATNSQLLNCGTNGNSITHKTISGDLPEISFEWTAPQGFSGQAQFVGTIALNGGVFWVKHTSNSFRIA